MRGTEGPACVEPPGTSADRAGRTKPISRPADRLDEPVAAPGIQLAAEAPDVDLDDVRSRRVVGIPHGVEEAILREHLPGMASEDLEQRELARRQADLHTGAANDHRRRGELEIADMDDRRTVGAEIG